jgi:thioredoxin reductase
MTPIDLLGVSGKPYDIAIVGGGPAGLSAAIWAGRYGRQVVLVDRGDPRNWATRGVNGYLGLSGVRPGSLREAGRVEAARYDVLLADAEVLRVEPCLHATRDTCFALHLAGGDTWHARRVLLAFGLTDVWPDIPGLEQVYGTSAHVCPDCDGHESRGLRIAVVGAGRRAMAMALALRTWSAMLTIATNGRPARLSPAARERLRQNGITLRTEAIERVVTDGPLLQALAFASGDVLAVDKLFFNVAQRPADDLAAQLGCTRDRGGHVMVSVHGATTAPSVFAAGDITPGPQLAIRAAAAGAVAAMAMHKSLLPVERTVAGV